MRRRTRSEEHYQQAMAQDLATWAGEPHTGVKKKKRAGIWNRAVVREEVSSFIASREWNDAHPRHFVELYSRLHFDVYGVEPLEMKATKMCMAAASLAAKALRDHFDGDANLLADFMRWVWSRQSAEEKKRRAGAKDGDFRVTWRYQWSPKLVTDYRRSLLTAKSGT